MALTASPITPLTVSSLERLYQQFLLEAKDDYGWTEGAIPFEMLVEVLSTGNLHAIALEDTTKTPAESSVVGFMLYRIEPHNAIEINLVCLEKGLPQKTAVDKLFGYAITHWQTIPNWEVISYAMLGKQTTLIQTLTWYGFKPVGQCVMNLDLTDPLLMPLLIRQKQEKRFTPPDGLHFVQWQPDFVEPVASMIYEAFHTKSDALWDPRFRSEKGALTVIDLITSGRIGDFYPNYSWILATTPSPKTQADFVGFSFLVQADLLTGNIPLIGLIKNDEYRNKGLGKGLLQHAIINVVDGILNGELPMLNVHATVDTDNSQAVKMYRSVYFQETSDYAHAYLTRETAMAFKTGQWVGC
jgi:predicted SnoaL-like aldol condensation-catalyzing enzyme